MIVTKVMFYLLFAFSNMLCYVYRLGCSVELVSLAKLRSRGRSLLIRLVTLLVLLALLT